MSAGSPLEVPFRALSSGISSGLSFTLDLQSSLYGCPVSSSRGFKLSLHSGVSAAPSMLDHGCALSPGREHFVAASPDVVYASEEIWNIPADTRRCFLYHERRLAFYDHYTEENCHSECEANRTMEARRFFFFFFSFETPNQCWRR